LQSLSRLLHFRNLLSLYLLLSLQLDFYLTSAQVGSLGDLLLTGLVFLIIYFLSSNDFDWKKKTAKVHADEL